MIIIREATAEDIPGLLLMIQTFIRESHWGYTYSEKASLEILDEYMGDALGAVYVAVEHGEYLGFWTAFVCYEFVEQPCCYVGKFYVMPDGRGLGVGRLLMQKLVACADDYKCLHTFLTGTAKVHQDKLFVNLCKKYDFEECGQAMVRVYEQSKEGI